MSVGGIDRELERSCLVQNEDVEGDGDGPFYIFIFSMPLLRQSAIADTDGAPNACHDLHS